VQHFTKNKGFYRVLSHIILQGGEDTLDVLSCRSFSAKEPLVIGLFGGKWPLKIRHPKGLRHPVPQTLTWRRFGKGYIWIQESITWCKISRIDIYIYIYMYLYTNLESFWKTRFLWFCSYSRRSITLWYKLFHCTIFKKYFSAKWLHVVIQKKNLLVQNDCTLSPLSRVLYRLRIHSRSMDEREEKEKRKKETIWISVYDSLQICALWILRIHRHQMTRIIGGFLGLQSIWILCLWSCIVLGFLRILLRILLRIHRHQMTLIIWGFSGLRRILLRILLRIHRHQMTWIIWGFSGLRRILVRILVRIHRHQMIWIIWEESNRWQNRNISGSFVLWGGYGQ